MAEMCSVFLIFTTDLKMLALIDLQIKYLNFSKENSERGGRHMTQIVISLIC